MRNNLTSKFGKLYSREEKRREEKRREEKRREELNYALLLARSKLLRSVIPYG